MVGWPDKVRSTCLLEEVPKVGKKQGQKYSLGIRSSSSMLTTYANFSLSPNRV